MIGFDKFKWIKITCRSTLILKSRYHDYRILSGIQPTGSIHLGNYFGAIRQWINYQRPQQLPSLSNDDKNDLNSEKKYLPPIFQIVDLHSLTASNYDPNELRINIKEIVAVLIGCGINPKQSLLFKQSSIPYHGYLCWILTTLTTLPQLHRFPQFKEKSIKFNEPPTGLFIYPILQSADILLYKGTHVPVGDDQLAHINMTKHISAKFNNKFNKKIFPIPLEIISEKGAGRIKSLRSPEQKMSKSELDTKSRIELTDSDDDIIRKIRKSVTDMKSEVTYEPDSRPGVTNLINIYSLITNTDKDEICEKFIGKTTFEFKMELGEQLVEYIRPIRNRIKDLRINQDYLDAVLKDGSTKAMEIAEKTIDDVKQVIGLS